MKNNLSKNQKEILEKAGLINPHSANLDLYVGRKISFFFQQKKRCLLITDIVMTDENPSSLVISFYSCYTGSDCKDSIHGLDIRNAGNITVIKASLEFGHMDHSRSYDEITDIKIF